MHGLVDPGRWGALAAAGFNVMNLQEEEVAVDLFTDIQPHPPFPPLDDTRFPSTTRHEPDLHALATALYGPWRFLATSKGRSAETALIAAMLPRGAVVIGHPLFMSWEHALADREMRRELAPWTADRPTSDIDLGWLQGRLGAGGVTAVVLEPGCNALGARPLTLDNVAAASKLCRAHGVPLILDATRLLACCHALGMTPLVDAAQAYTALADALTISCAKELLSPAGGLVAVRDLATQRRAWQHARMEGTLLEPHAERLRLAQGCERVLRHPEVIATRARQLAMLAATLAEHGVGVLEPVGVHALYVPIPEELVRGGAPAIRALEAHIYLRCGARVISGAYPALPGRVARLAVGVGRYADADLVAIAPALRHAFTHPEDAPTLVEVPHEELSPNRVRYRAEARPC